MVDHSGVDGARSRWSSSASPVYGFSRVPDRLPADRGPGLPARHRAVARRRLARAHPEGARPGQRDRRKTPGVEQVITIAGVSALDNNATLANAGVAYIILKDWSERGKGEDLLSLFTRLERDRSARSTKRDILVHAAAADPGHRQCRRLHHAGRAARRQLRPRQAAERDRCDRRPMPRPRSRMQLVQASFRAERAAITVEVDREKAQTLHVSRRPGVLRARELSRLELCRPVQQVRPHLPDLRAGRRAVPPAARGHRRT